MRPNRDRLTARVRLLLAVPLFLGACAAPAFDAAAVVKEWVAYMNRDYVLRPGDRVAVTLYGVDETIQRELTQEIVISPTGSVHLRRIPKELNTRGLSIGAFRRKVQAAYAEILVNAEVSVQLVEATVPTVYVAGQVRHAGAIAYVPGMSLAQAVSSAGGFDIRAKSSDVRVLRYHGRESVQTYRVNMNTVLFGEGPDFLLLPGDVVWCQTSAIADLNDLVTLYIHRLLPIPVQGVAIGGPQ